MYDIGCKLICPTHHHLSGSVRGGPGAVRQPADHGLRPPHPRHLPPQPPVHGQGGAGVRASRHLPPRPPPVGRRLGARRLLRDPLHGHLRQDRHENCYLRDSPSGGINEIKICYISKMQGLFLGS